MDISFVIPTLNAQEHLTKCLSSIRRQTIPAEILIVDGGSTDKTLEIAEAYKCKILANPFKLAEFGVRIGIIATNTELVVVFAADNELPHEEWIAKVFYVFISINPSAVWGGIIGDEKPINQYFGLIQSDPLSWFLKPPYVWGANGLIYKTKDIKPIWNVRGYVGDNDAFQTLLEQGKNVLFVEGLTVIHHHCKSIRHCVGKWWRNHIKHYLPYRRERNLRWLGKNFYCKVLFWCVYVVFFSFMHSIYLMIKDRNRAWLYHFPLSFCQMCIYIYAGITHPTRI